MNWKEIIERITQSTPNQAPLSKPVAGRSTPSGALYIVATPIGNLHDITVRALLILSGCDRILAENTAKTYKLLQHYQIESKPITQFHDEPHEISKNIAALQSGSNIALVSDAGTPAISDPGSRLVMAARSHSIKVIPIPGASSPIAALSVSGGLAGSEWAFFGFLPQSTGRKLTKLQQAKSSNLGAVFFESPRRLLATLEAIITLFGGEKQIIVARELTKLHEEINVDAAKQILESYQSRSAIKGEIVLIIPNDDARTANDSGEPQSDADQLHALQESTHELFSALFDAGVSPSAAAKVVSSVSRVRATIAYKLSLKHKEMREKSEKAK